MIPDGSKDVGYSVVVLGHHVPSLHHPAWYHHQELISEAEYEAALRSETFVTDQRSIFSCCGLTVACRHERWTVKTDAPCQDAARVKGLAQGVFELLPATMVSSFGLNLYGSFKVGSSESGEILGAKVGDACASFVEGHRVGGKWSVIIQVDDLALRTLSVEGDGAFVHVAVNVHRRMALSDGEAYTSFDLGALIEEYHPLVFDRGWEDIAKVLESFPPVDVDPPEGLTDSKGRIVT